MMRIAAVVALFDGLRETDVLTWVDRGWVRPEDGVFHDVDVARARLIHELLFRMDVREDSVPLILSLLDQIYELRGSLQSLSRAISAQPRTVRDAILAEAGLSP